MRDDLGSKLCELRCKLHEFNRVQELKRERAKKEKANDDAPKKDQKKTPRP